MSVVVVSALIVGKVVVILDKTPVGTRVDNRQPGLAALYKTLFYTAATFLVIIGEKAFHAYRESGALGSAVAEDLGQGELASHPAPSDCVGLHRGGSTICSSG